MKKILICTRDFHTGGVQKSLIDLLKQLETQITKGELQVDVFVLKKIGELVDEIPNYVNVIEADSAMWNFGITMQDAKLIGRKQKINRFFNALLTKFCGNRGYLKKCLKKQPFLGDYDTVVSYAVSISNKGLYAGWTEAALSKCNSKNKVIFIHNDFVKSGLDNPYTFSLVEKFDKIIFVSQSCMNSFTNKYSSLKEKCDYIYNFVDDKKIIEKSKEKIEPFCKDVFNIISVSRLSPEKAHLRSLDVFYKLKEDGMKFCWHILGDGPTRKKIEKKIKKLNLQDCVRLYGNKSNPYPYIKQADLFYLGSLHEAAPLVFNESKILNTPILTTNTCSATEFVGLNGLVCDNDFTGIYKAFNKLFNIVQKIEIESFDIKFNQASKEKLLKILTQKEIL